jgi:hypothetical protein
MRSIIFIFLFSLVINVFGKTEKPQPTGELLSMGYLANHTFADALLKFKSVDDKLKANSTDRNALWELGLVYFTIANNDKNYLNRCLESWDNYLRLYPNDAFALWNRAFVKHYFKTGNPCSDVQAAMQSVKKKFLPQEPAELTACFKKKK